MWYCCYHLVQSTIFGASTQSQCTMGSSVYIVNLVRAAEFEFIIQHERPANTEIHKWRGRCCKRDRRKRAIRFS